MYIFVVVFGGGGGGGGSDGKTSSTHPHNPLLTPLRWLLPGLQFFQLENDLVHIFETREVFIFLLACTTRNSLQCPLQFRGVFRKTISDEQIWTKQNTYYGTQGIFRINRGLNIRTDAVFQM